MTTKSSRKVGAVGEIVIGRLSTLQRIQGITQEELAAKTGIGQSQISRIMSLKTAINVDQLAALCEALDADMADIVDPDSPTFVALEKLTSKRKTRNNSASIVSINGRLNPSAVEGYAMAADSSPLEPEPGDDNYGA